LLEANQEVLLITDLFGYSHHQQLHFIKITLLSQKNKIDFLSQNEVFQHLSNDEGLQSRIMSKGGIDIYTFISSEG
jgi:hypothetical protein